MSQNNAYSTKAVPSLQKLYLSGQNYSNVTTSAMTYDQVIVDFMSLSNPTTDGNGYIFAENYLGSPFVLFNNSGNDLISSGLTVYDGNGVQQTTNTDFIKSNTRMTLDIKLASADSHGSIFFLKPYTETNPVEGYIYDIKMYYAKTLVAHYDFTSGSAKDQSGNGNDATVVGGTWMADSATPTDIYAPYNITSPTISNLTSNSFKVSWTRSKSNDIAKYNIYQGNTLIGTVYSPTVSYTISGLTYSTSYNFNVTSVDTSNNESAGFPFMVTTAQRTDAIPPVTSGMVFNADFTNRKGAIYNTVNDTVNNVLSTLPNSFGNQTGYYPSISLYNNISYGWVDNNGIKLIGNIVNSTNSSVHSYTKSSSLSSMDVSQGLTIETGYYLTSNNYQLLHNITGTGGMEAQLTTSAYTISLTYVSTGMEVDTLTINHAATSSGTVTVSLNGTTYQVTTITSGDTPSAVASKIAAVTFTGWNVSASNNVVTFTKTTSGTNKTPSYSAGSTGASGTMTVTATGGNTGAVKTYSLSDTGSGTNIMSNIVNGNTRHFADTLNHTGELNHFVTRLHSNGIVDIMINEYILSGKIPDFSSWNNWFSVNDIYWGGWKDNTLSYARIYNRSITDAEMKQNYDFQMSNQPFVGVSIIPSSVTLSPGDTQTLIVQANPSYFSSKLTNTFASENNGVVTVDSNGVLTGVADGETNIQVISKYNGQTFNNLVNVTVGTQQVSTPTPSRNLSGIAIARQKNSIELGENYACMAYTLPYDTFYDNVLIWSTSDPAICTVTEGVLEGKAPGTATITVQDSSQQFSQNFIVTVNPVVSTTITTAQTYNVTLSNYGIYGNNTNSTATTNGIINALNYASSNGYKKIVFPKATYLITPAISSSPTNGVIKLPSNMIIDFSGSTINIERSSYTSTGYTMFLMDQVENTQLINTNVYGEADSATIQTSVEGCISLIIRDAFKSGLNSCTFSKSPGFNVATGTTQVKAGTTYVYPPYTDFVAGNISDTGADDNTTIEYHFRTSAYYDISGLGRYFLLGYTNGYMGYPYLRSRLYSIYFYDSNKKFVTCLKYCRQFYNYDMPSGVKYARLVIYQETAPTSGDSDFNRAVAFLKTMGMPRDCFITNSTFENNFSTGVAMTGGQNWLIKGNYFSGNNGRMPGCDMDWEDGWETAVGDIVRENMFNSTLSISTASSQLIHIFNNKFNNSYIHMWNRTTAWYVYNNTFNGKGGGTWNISLGTQEDSYFDRNTLEGGISYNTTQDLYNPGANYSVHFNGNNTI
jgi:hypothetical protein